ncbi:MAG TPA: cyclodeaminase/cyclohydrolase family protein [Thermoplasmata archaeon]|nr:cyclodeaminase/cyclohydrolase family protein [Thermoplasmata archaeon]
MREVDAGAPGGESIASFTGRLAARTPTPGGGSAAALAAALGAALGEMVLAYSIDPKSPLPELEALAPRLTAARRRFLELVDEDARSYDAVRAAKKRRKESPGAEADAAYLAAVRNAAEVPLATARLATELSAALEAVGTKTKAALGSDLVTAVALFRAATDGALANVAINLEDLRAAGASVSEIEPEIARLRPKA